MLKLKLLLLTLLMLFINTASKSQYILQTAFPNLPIFQYPVEIVSANDGTKRLFVVEQWGKINVLNPIPSVNSKKIFIDLSTKIYSSFETGLFGLAFHPNYVNNRYFYVHYVFDSAGSPTNKWLRIARYTASQSNPDTALLNTEVQLIKTPLPGGNLHNGGKVAFGPDGYLYISFGDGYTNGDPSQDRTSLLGKVLRINVDSATAGRNYSIPTSNPYFENNLGYREEIYAYGFRNMWKFSFDFPTNRLYGADVGEESFEEINLVENGKNYGWNKMEGFNCYGVCDTTGKGFTRPIFAYPRTVGRSISGGYVYRGALLPELYGKYIYADFQDGEIWALNYDGINPTTSTTLINTSFRFSTFGLDEDKEIYIANYFVGTIYKIANSNISTLKLKAAIEGFFNVQTGKLNIRDTVQVLLRSTVIPYSPVDSFKTVIDSVSLEGLCFFPNAPTGKYYITVKHRNSVETWSRAGGDSITKAIVRNFDFTTDSSKAYGNNLIKVENKYCIYSGDINQNGVVDVIDQGLVDNDVFSFGTGYLPTDVNGDRISDVLDLSFTANNAYRFVSKITPP